MFSIKDLDELSYFLGVEISKTSDVLHPSQIKYIKDLLDNVQLH